MAIPSEAKKKIFQLFVVSATMVLMAHGQQQNPGFMSIDCGAPNDYHDDNLDIYYKTDQGFVSTGVNMQVSSQVIYQNKQQQGKNLRAFPDGTRNCYTLSPERGKRNTYLIRAAFWYGNYDGRNQTPKFDLHIDVNYWSTIYSDSYVYEEVIYVPPEDDINVCLVNTGSGTPFISVLELRLLDNSTYQMDSGALATSWRYNIGGGSYTYRHPDDEYDRIWAPQNYKEWVQIANETSFDLTTYNDAYGVPAGVLMTAAQSAKVNKQLVLFWTPSSPTEKWYMYFHFAEIQVLQETQVREFEVYIVDQLVKTIRPLYGKPMTVASFPVTSPSQINFTLSVTSRSDLPPILNAVELMYGLDLTNPMTDSDDGKYLLFLYSDDCNSCLIFLHVLPQPVDAINNIKKTYRVVQDSWQGDPCSPRNLSWNGLNCHYDSIPRIISLNLSSSNLVGKIVDSLINLTALTSLDLSHNQLTSQIPDFLGQMPNLKLLNLSGNNLSGSIPQSLKRKQTIGALQASFDRNPNLCQTDSCSTSTTTSNGKKGKSPIVLIIAACVSVLVVILLGTLTVIWRNKRRKGVSAVSVTSTGPVEGPMVLGVPRSQTIFTSSEISTITDNYRTVIGEGGFGKVYLGILYDGTKVAVKIPSKYSVQGYREFQAEAQLLMIVHHRNLVSLVGYCDEVENMALIYEFMSNGNLRQHLSEYNTNVLSWSQRLQIAVEAAQGLEYLHNGCKPPIIHRDLKTSNILLNESMQANIADFGLSKAFATDYDSHISTRPAGTPGYLDPEFHASGNLSKKSDVYSFGIILFELITGHPAIIRTSDGNIHIIHWVTPLIERGDIQSIVDPRFSGQCKTNSAWKAVEIAMSCVMASSSQRPDMIHVLSDLKECLGLEIASERNQRSGYNSYMGRSTSFEMTSVELNAAPNPR
ncbi:probable LRR receptor-like serine/threonine-protein kinase At1g05700 [Punica granatum]|uniref:non-specific serine/threonine protein kinase n=1 Tax=Punica granatum TaxID=22663 RepID=A0A6P8CN59_PUNGR|nr:probable LRR receptor-like serine/threonine-protein kinase At1g05700 [Punica granatum]